MLKNKSGSREFVLKKYLVVNKKNVIKLQLAKATEVTVFTML